MWREQWGFPESLGDLTPAALDPALLHYAPFRPHPRLSLEVVQGGEEPGQTARVGTRPAALCALCDLGRLLWIKALVPLSIGGDHGSNPLLSHSADEVRRSP